MCCSNVTINPVVLETCIRVGYIIDMQIRSLTLFFIINCPRRLSTEGSKCEFFLPAYIHTDICTYVHACIHTHSHMYVHTYIHPSPCWPIHPSWLRTCMCMLECICAHTRKRRLSICNIIRCFILTVEGPWLGSVICWKSTFFGVGSTALALYVTSSHRKKGFM